MASSVLGAVEDIHAALVRAGMTLEQAIRAYRIMWEFTLGALLVRAGARAPSTPAGAPAPSVQARLRGAPDPERYPTLAASAPTWRAIEGRDTYRADLETLLDGLLAGAARATTHSAPDNPEASA
jgi:hypothetical protein